MDEPSTEGMIKVGDSARIDFPASHYHDVIGKVYKIQEATQYAILDMPKGIQLERENADRNIIIERLKASKLPRSKWPKGDPMWVPLEMASEGRPGEPGRGNIVTDFAPRILIIVALLLEWFVERAHGNGRFRWSS